MTERGIVVSTNNKSATVKVKRTSACGHECGECRLCSAPELEVNVENSIGAKIGDTVVIEAASSKILRMAFTLYVLPIMGAIIIGGISFSILSNKIAAVLSIVAWLILWFAYVKHWGMHFSETSKITEVIYEKD